MLSSIIGAVRRLLRASDFMLWYVIFLIITFAFGFMYGHGIKPDEEPEQETAIDFFKLCEIIEDMNGTKNKLKQVDRLLLDLQLADENGQEISLSWVDNSKSDNHYSVIINNDNNCFAEEIRKEQARLRSHLLDCADEIERLRSPLNGE